MLIRLAIGASRHAPPDDVGVWIALTTAMITVLTGIVSLLSQWHAYREALDHRARNIQDDTNIVQFWEQWLKVQTSATAEEKWPSLRAHVEERLHVLPTFQPTDEMVKTKTEPVALRRSLLLFRQANLPASISRLVFLLFAVATTFYLLELIIWLAYGMPDIIGGVSGSDLMISVATSLALALMFRGFSVGLNKVGKLEFRWWKSRPAPTPVPTQDEATAP
jgi:hypothetical protein